MKRKSVVFIFAVLLALLFSFSAVADTETQTTMETAVSYEGFAARLKGNATAIRSLYTVDMDKVAALEAEGYEVHIGAVMGIANYKGVDVNRVSDLLVSYDHETKKVKLASGVSNASRVVVYATGDMVYASDLWVAQSGTKWKFAFTATNESENVDFYTADLCFRAFAVLVDGDGNATVTYSDGVGEVFGDSASIYEVALYFHNYKDGVYKDNTLLNTAIAYCKNYEWTDVAASVGSGVTLSSGAAVITGKDAEGATLNSVYMPKNAKITVVVDAAMEGIYGIGVRYANTAASGSGKNLNVKNKTVAHSVTNVMRLQSVSGEGISETLTTADGTAYTVPVEDAAYRGCGGSGESAYAAYVYLEKGLNEVEIWVTGTPIVVSSVKFTMLRGAGYDADEYILLKASEASAKHNINYNGTYKTFYISNGNGKYVDFTFTVKESGVYSMGAMMGWLLNNEARVIQFYDATDDTKTGADFIADQSGSKLLYTYSKSQCSDYRHSNLPSASDAGALNFREFGEAYFSKGEHTLRVYTNGQIITLAYVSLVLEQADTEPKTDIEVDCSDLAPKNGGSRALDEKTAYIGVGNVNSYNSQPYIATTVEADIEGMYAIYGKYVFANNAGTTGANCDLFVKNNSTDEGKGGAFYGYSLKTNAASPTDYSVPREVKKGDYLADVMCYVYLNAGENDLQIFNHTGGKIGIYALKFSLVTEGGLPNSVFVKATGYDDKTSGSEEQIGTNKYLHFTKTGAGKSYADYSVTVNESGYYHLYASLGYNKTGTNAVKFSDIVENGDGSITVKEVLSYTLESSLYITNYRGMGEADVGYIYLEKGTHTIRYELMQAGHVVSMLNFRLYREDPIRDSGTQLDRNGNLVVRGKLNANALVTLCVTDIETGEVLHLASTRSDKNGEYRFETHQNLDFVYYTIATEYSDAVTKGYATKLLTTSVVAERVRDNAGSGADSLSVVYRIANYSGATHTVGSLVFSVTAPDGSTRNYDMAVTDGTVKAGEAKDFVFTLDPAILPESTYGYVFGAYAVGDDGNKIVSTEGDTMIYMEDFMETIQIAYNPNAPEREARGDYSIAYLGDLHYGRVEFKLCSTMDERAQAMIDMLISEYEKGSFDVVFFNGDMVYNECSKNGGIAGTNKGMIAAAHYSEDNGKTVFWNYDRLKARYGSYFNGKYTAVDSDVTFVTADEWREGVSYDTERVFIVDGDVDITDKAVQAGFCALEKTANYVDNMQILHDRYLAQLTEAGIPWFMANGNHDSYTDDDFERLFGYPKNFAVSIVGTDGEADTLQCVIDPHHVRGIDCLYEEGGFEMHSALPTSVLEYFQKIMKGVDTYIVGHYYTNEPNTQALVKSEDVIGVVFGHTHIPSTFTYQGKPGAISTTFFTGGVPYYNAKNIVSSTVYKTLSEAEKANYTTSLNHTPWGIRFLERITDGETGAGRIESYVTFMERVYDGENSLCAWNSAANKEKYPTLYNESGCYYMEQEYYSTKGVADSVYTVVYKEIPVTAK